MTRMHVGRILLAEDDFEMRRLLAATLRNDGYAVVEAADGQEMLAILTAAAAGGEAIDLVVADIRMPHLTGLEVIEKVCLTQVTTPVILITAFGDLITHERAYELGAVAVLDKPFELDDLRSVVLYFRRRSWGRERLPEGYIPEKE